MTTPILAVSGLQKYFTVVKGFPRPVKTIVRAVDGVNFSVAPGEAFGLVGESGCGKSTVARALLRLIEPDAGRVHFAGVDVLAAGGAALIALRRRMQIIVQDPYSSLNPRRTIGRTLAEPLEVHGVAHGAAARARVIALLEEVGLPSSAMARYPHEFSGGQRQRIGIARALALGPKLIVADEPVSALDVSIQAQVINLLQDLQRERQLSYLFISHNLAVVEHISHRIAVMYLGRIVEYATTKQIFTNGQHPYTEALLSAVPVPDPAVKRQKRVLQGDVPSPVNPPPGCHFHTRCPYAVARCKVEAPPLREIAPGHHVSCHLR